MCSGRCGSPVVAVKRETIQEDQPLASRHYFSQLGLPDRYVKQVLIRAFAPSDPQEGISLPPIVGLLRCGIRYLIIPVDTLLMGWTDILRFRPAFSLTVQKPAGHPPTTATKRPESSSSHRLDRSGHDPSSRDSTRILRLWPQRRRRPNPGHS